MTETNEIGDFFELLSRAKWWILGVALVSALVAGVVGYPGPSLYESTVSVRVQFPQNLARAPQPDRFAQMSKQSATLEKAARAAGLTGSAALARKTITSSVSPSDPRVVVISVQTSNPRQGEAFLRALVGMVKADAMSSIRDQVNGLKQAKALNASIMMQTDKVIAQGRKVAKALASGGNATAGERLLAEVGLLQMNVSALQSRASLQNANAQVDADLESLNDAVLLDGVIVVKAISPLYRSLGYALRGLIVGLAVAMVAIFIPPVRRRLMS